MSFYQSDLTACRISPGAMSVRPYTCHTLKTVTKLTSHTNNFVLNKLTLGFEIVIEFWGLDIPPSVAVEWSVLLIRKGRQWFSGHDQETDNPGRFFVVFLKSYRKILGYCLKIWHEDFLPHNSHFIIRHHPTIRHYITYATERASLNKQTINED
jgi:hypothetical protein